MEQIQPTDMTARSTYLVAATVCVAIVVFLGWLAVTNDASLLVPPFIGLLAAWIFLIAAARLLQLSVRPHSKGDVFAALIFAGFAGIGGWIALSPDAQGCTIAVNDEPVAGTAGLACRIPFGIGAAISTALAIYAAVRAVNPIFKKDRLAAGHRESNDV